jgi:hypothetical protein
MKDIDKKREALKKAYPNAKWRIKVNKMDDRQVLAIYTRLHAQNVV